MEIFNFKAVPTDTRYYNEDSNYGVYVFNTEDDIPHAKETFNGIKVGTLAGKVQMLTLGLEYNIIAACEYNAKYKSYNYVPQTVTAVRPKTLEQQKKFLKTLITETQAENILQAYPTVVDDVMNGKEIDTSKIKGVGEITWKKIKSKIEENYGISEILMLLSPLGVTISVIEKLLDFERNPSLLKQRLIENPYILTKVSGIGFKRADEIALKLNEKNRISQYRTIAFIRWYLNSVANDTGDTWVYRSTLDNAVRDNINECYELYEKFMSEQEYGGQMLTIRKDKVGLKYIYDTEMSIVEILDELNSADGIKVDEIENGMSAAEKKQGFKYTDEQKDAIRKCCETNVVLITGQAGTGKSTILRGLVNIYENHNIACCALSAKAAQRIIETTGHPACTIHRLLHWFNGKFAYDANCPLPNDIIILDEASMVNSEIFKSLLVAVRPGAKVIICGDDEQLPPIGSANIFHDLLRSGKYNCCKLTRILRQAEKSGIILDSRKVRQNEFPVQSPEKIIVTGELQDMTYAFRQDRTKMRDFAVKTYLKSVKENGSDSTIIITPCKQNRENSTKEINRIVQGLLVPNSAEKVTYGKNDYSVGTKVIQRANNYEKNVFNGETGYIISVDSGKNKTVTVDFGSNKHVTFNYSELANLELAYALTVHVTQGSGYDNVIILIDNTHHKLLDSCLLYTAITRAKKKCLLIAEPSAFERCIKEKASERKTWLSLEYGNKKYKKF